MVALAAAPAAAQPSSPGGHTDTVRSVIDWVYDGVTPGSGHNPPRLSIVQRAIERGRHPRLMTWPGFQYVEGRGSRFFIQTSMPVTTRTFTEEGHFVVVLQDTGIHLWNNRRPLVTAWFNTPVSHAWVERFERNHAAFVLAMRGDAVPTVRTEPGQNGFHFVFVEFPDGNYLPEEYREPEPEPGQTGRVQSRQETLSPELQALDHERPPGM